MAVVVYTIPMNAKKTVAIQSPAKINLGFDIAERLEDGYHIVRMVMQTLDLCDTVTVSLREDADGTKGPVTIVCPGSRLPVDARNLAYRAAQLLIDDFDIGYGIDIVLRKRIPVAAGLAGGSGNAAAVLKAVNELCALGLSPQELRARGKKLGADVPYCLMQGTALAEGIGEQLTPLPDLTKGCVLLCKPMVRVSTRWAYEAWDEVKDQLHPDIDGLAACLREDAAPQERLIKAASYCANSFEPVIFPRFPIVRQMKETMLKLGAVAAVMSGSGPTVFGIFPDEERMSDAAVRMHRVYPNAFVAETHVRQKQKQDRDG